MSLTSKISTNKETIVTIKVILACAFWGGTYVAGKISAPAISAPVFGFLRFFIASIFLYYICKRRKEEIKLEKKNFIPLLLLSLSGCVLFNFFIQLGLETVSATKTSLIAATQPLFITLFAILLLGEKVNFLQSFGLFISMIGAALVITDGNFSSIHTILTIGDLYVILGFTCWIIYALLGKKLVQNISPLLSSTTISIMAMCIFAPFALHDFIYLENNFSIPVLLSCAYCGIAATALAFVWFSDGLKVIGATRSSIYLNLEPISAVLLAILILGESLSLIMALGGIITFIGLYLTNINNETIVRILKKIGRKNV